MTSTGVTNMHKTAKDRLRSRLNKPMCLYILAANAANAADADAAGSSRARPKAPAHARFDGSKEVHSKAVIHSNHYK